MSSLREQFQKFHDDFNDGYLERHWAFFKAGAASTWHEGNPPKDGVYICEYFECEYPGQEENGASIGECSWFFGQWSRTFHQGETEVSVKRWTYMPELPEGGE